MTGAGALRAGRAGAAAAFIVGALQLGACAGAPAVTPLEGRTPGQARLRAYNRPYEVRGRRYTPVDAPGYDETGLASWYGYESGRRTADGEAFTLEGLTAAHRTLPIPSLLEVTNLQSGARVVVRLNDRGPFVEGRLIDLSHEAARRLGLLGHGTARVRVRYLGPAGAWPTRQVARAAPAHAPPPAMRLEPVGAIDPMQLVATLPPAGQGAGAAARVQAGAFADPRLARMAADRLGEVGACTVEVLGRSSGVQWRVVVSGAPGDGARLVAEAAALGFPGARVLAD